MKTLILLLASINFVVLLSLSALHMFWAFGNSLGFNKTLPTDVNGKRILNPRKIDCVIVSIFLLGFGLIFIGAVGLILLPIPTSVYQYGSWVISIIFLLRAFGDFKFVGFTKRIKSTEFARMDTKYYSPLCLALGLSGLVISFMSL